MTYDVKIIRWNNFHSVLFTLLFILYTVLSLRFPVIIGGAISFLYYWIIHLGILKTFKPFAGYANRTTSLRLILVIIAGIFYNNLPDFVLFFIGISIFSLDGLDGYLARKFNQKSEFGAYFDMETDAFYVCIFTIILFEKDFAGYWILIPGFLRYFYGTIILLVGRKAKEEIRTKLGPVIAGIFFVSILSPFVLSSAFYNPALIVSSSLVVMSFIYSFIQNLSFITD